jgi:predicted nucleotidyltransferase component of viral defense system
MIVEELKFVFDKNKDKNPLYLRNLLKEQLQYYVLNFVYNSLYGEKFLFKGGTCLRFCFDLPRLSEDLDFDVKDFSSFDYQVFIKDLKEYFVSKLKYQDFEVKISGKNRLIYLKFPILEKIGFPVEKEKPSDNILFLRIDLSDVLGKNFKEEISLKSTWAFSFLIKRYSLADIFSGKIAAILSRETFEGKEKTPRFKGRDYFDIFWLKEKGIKYNFDYLKTLIKIKNEEELKEKLSKKFQEAKKKIKFLKEDLLPFFSQSNFVENFVNNFDVLVENFFKND